MKNLFLPISWTFHEDEMYRLFFNDHSHAHSTADTHADQAAVVPISLHVMHRADHLASAGAANWMTE